MTFVIAVNTELPYHRRYGRHAFLKQFGPKNILITFHANPIIKN